MIQIPDLGDEFHAMWLELIALAEARPAPWVLVGAHMVALLGWEFGREQIRPSIDADVLVDVRAVTNGTERLSGALVERGFTLSAVSPDGIGHRFVRNRVSIDVLGPDGVGQRANLRTTDGARTVQVPGGSQAIRRARTLAVRTRRRRGSIPVPSLLGAILVKVRAISVDDQPRAQRADVAFLFSLVADPDPLAAELTMSERQWLRRCRFFGDPFDISYRGIAEAEDAATVYRRLADVP